MAGMHPGESKTFPLSAEEGFGPHDETRKATPSLMTQAGMPGSSGSCRRRRWLISIIPWRGR
jgi:hypothetical protein